MGIARRLPIRLRGGLAVGAALACVALPAAAAARLSTAAVRSSTPMKTKKCGGGDLCSTSLSSSSPPLSVGGSGPGGGSPTPPPPEGTAGPPAPSSVFDVTAKPRSSNGERIRSGSQMVESLDTGKRLSCKGYARRDRNWFQFMLRSANRTQILYDITDTIANTTPNGIHFCLGAHFDFTTFSGRLARHIKLPDGTIGYVGLLPMCVTNAAGAIATTGPCVISIAKSKDPNSSTGINTILTAQIPAATMADPWAGG